METAQLPVTQKSNLNLISQTYEKLINQTQTDLDLFKHEQIHLRGEISSILQENQTLNTKLEAVQSSVSGVAESRDDATREQLTRDALKNVQLQIEYLQAENRELRLHNKSLRKIVRNLQQEIQNYREDFHEPNRLEEVKQKYTTTIKLLECTITNQKAELSTQGQVIENLYHQKRDLCEQLQEAQQFLKERNVQNSNGFSENATVLKLQEQISELLKQKKALEKALKVSRRVMDERMMRERRALEKVQEALSIAESAVADKECAQKREQVIKEECDNLASTIGLIMEQAAQKVDQDIVTITKKFADKEQLLIEKYGKLNEELLNHKKFNEIVETRCNRIEQKYKELVIENEKLATNLQKALHSFDEMEVKLANSDQVIQADKRAQAYKNAMEDVTQKFEMEISRLQKENDGLKEENRKLKGSNNPNVNG